MQLFFKQILILLLITGFLLYYRFFPFGPLIEGKYLFFIFWIFFLALFNVQGKISAFLGLLLLILSGLLLFLNHQGIALRVITYSYYFLTIGTFFEFFAVLKNKQ